MAETVSEKYGVRLPAQEDLNRLLHPPQLLLTALFHTNSRCKDLQHLLDRLPSKLLVPDNQGRALDSNLLLNILICFTLKRK